MADGAEKRASRYKHIRADAIRVVPRTGSGPTHAHATPRIFRPGPFPDFGVDSRLAPVCSGKSRSAIPVHAAHRRVPAHRNWWSHQFPTFRKADLSSNDPRAKSSLRLAAKKTRYPPLDISELGVLFHKLREKRTISVNLHKSPVWSRQAALGCEKHREVQGFDPICTWGNGSSVGTSSITSCVLVSRGLLLSRSASGRWSSPIWFRVV